MPKIPNKICAEKVEYFFSHWCDTTIGYDTIEVLDSLSKCALLKIFESEVV